MASWHELAEMLTKRIKDLTRTATSSDLTDGEFVAVDKTDGYTRKMTVVNLATWVLGKIKNLPTTITSFRNGDSIVVDGPNGPAKMPASDLQDAILGGPIDEAVQQWLDEHPEATTTVEDHSLTYQKLVNGTLNFVTPEMFGAVGDGVTDDTAAIQAAMDACSVVLFGDKTYMINAKSHSSCLQCNEGQHLILGKCTLKSIPNQNTSGNYAIINTRTANNVIIEGGHLVGERDTHGTASHIAGFGIYIANSNFVTVRDVEIENFLADGILVCAQWDPTIPWEDYPWGDFNNNIYISRCHIHHNRRQGISLVNAYNVVIDSCVIHDILGSAPEYAIDIEPDGSVRKVKNVLISRLYCYGGARKSIAFSGNNTVTSNCTVVDSFLAGAFNAIVDFKLINTTITVHANLIGSVSGTFVGCHLAQLQVSGGSELYFDNCVLGEPEPAGASPLMLIKGYSSQNENFYKIYANNSKFTRNNPTGESWGYVVSPAIPSKNSIFSFTNCEFIYTNPASWNANIFIPWGRIDFNQCRFVLSSPLATAAIRATTSIPESAHLDITVSDCTFINYSSILSQISRNASIIIRNCKVVTPMTHLVTSGGSVERTLNVRAQTNCYESLPPEYVAAPSGASNFTVNLTVSGDYYIGMHTSGSSSYRPSGLGSGHVGYLYFDTDLGKMIAWNGTAWVNADGTALS